MACLAAIGNGFLLGGSAPMEELQEADVLWPETTPPSRDCQSRPPELLDAAVGFSCEVFGSDDDGPAASSSMSSTSSSSSVLPFGGGSSGGFLSYPSTFAGGHGGDGDMAEEFQEADVLWPDDGYATGERAGADGGELWWLCCGFGGDAAGYHRAEPAAGGQLRAWRPPVSSPIDIPTGVATAAARRRRPGVVLVHRRSIGTD